MFQCKNTIFFFNIYTDVDLYCLKTIIIVMHVLVRECTQSSGIFVVFQTYREISVLRPLLHKNILKFSIFYVPKILIHTCVTP